MPNRYIINVAPVQTRKKTSLLSQLDFRLLSAFTELTGLPRWRNATQREIKNKERIVSKNFFH
jgi:hypothetical protein